MKAPCITSKEDLLATVAQCALNVPHIVPLLMASYRDELSLALLGRGTIAPLATLDRARMPAVVLVGDDYADGLDPGPAGWPDLQRLARWARFAVVNATGGFREYYEMFVAMAIEHRRLLVVETGTARADAWLALRRAVEVPTIVIKPEDGGVQPVMPKRGDLH